MKAEKRYELGVCFQKTDILGRTESHVLICEKTEDSWRIMGRCLCTITFVGRDLKEAMGIVDSVFIKTLNNIKPRKNKP
jgi:hypothetical protein